jgi:hypothetical protein
MESKAASRNDTRSSGEMILRALTAMVIAFVLGALSYAVWIGLINVHRIGV